MNHSISIDLPEDVYQAVQNAAEQCRSTPSQWIATQLRRQLVTQPRPETADGFEHRFEQYLGCVDSGDSNSADNERIDEDLARQYEGKAAKDV